MKITLTKASENTNAASVPLIDNTAVIAADAVDTESITPIPTDDPVEPIAPSIDSDADDPAAPSTPSVDADAELSDAAQTIDDGHHDTPSDDAEPSAPSDDNDNAKILRRRAAIFNEYDNVHTVISVIARYVLRRACDHVDLRPTKHVESMIKSDVTKILDIAVIPYEIEYGYGEADRAYGALARVCSRLADDIFDNNEYIVCNLDGWDELFSRPKGSVDESSLAAWKASCQKIYDSILKTIEEIVYNVVVRMDAHRPINIHFDAERLHKIFEAIARDAESTAEDIYIDYAEAQTFPPRALWTESYHTDHDADQQALDTVASFIRVLKAIADKKAAIDPQDAVANNDNAPTADAPIGVVHIGNPTDGSEEDIEFGILDFIGFDFEDDDIDDELVDEPNVNVNADPVVDLQAAADDPVAHIPELNTFDDDDLDKLDAYLDDVKKTLCDAVHACNDAARAIYRSRYHYGEDNHSLWKERLPQYLAELKDALAELARITNR